MKTSLEKSKQANEDFHPKLNTLEPRKLQGLTSVVILMFYKGEKRNALSVKFFQILIGLTNTNDGFISQNRFY